jgi:hypothetical protein
VAGTEFTASRARDGHGWPILRVMGNRVMPTNPAGQFAASEIRTNHTTHQPKDHYGTSHGCLVPVVKPAERGQDASVGQGLAADEELGEEIHE